MSDALADRVTVLTDEATRLRQDVAGLRDQLATTRGRVWWVALLAVIALALGVGLVVVAAQSQATDDRVNAICPVLALVVGGYDPNTRTAGPARDAYVRSFAVMREAYTGTRCDQVAPLVPPRQGSS
jgi:uncharacterized membrane protein